MGYRQNEVEILPNWFIYRKEEISLVKAVANRKGLGDKKGELSLVEDVIWTSSKRWTGQPMESSRGLGNLQRVNEFFCLQRRGLRDLMKVASMAER